MGDYSALLVEDATTFEEEYDLLECIGQGNYGSVFRACHIRTDTTVAVKSVYANQTHEKDTDSLKAEIEIMKNCHSDYVLRYFGNFVKDEVMWLVMEFCGLGSCRDVMNLRDKPFTEDQIAEVCHFVLLGLDYLHNRRLIHRDIKSDNLMMNQKGQIKLGDFGVSGSGDRMQTVIGTPYFLAPEVIINEGTGTYGNSVDVWSLGITVIEMAEMNPPNHDVMPMKVLFNLPTAPPPTFSDPSKYSPECIDFLSHTLIKDPEKRAKVKQLLAHKWVTSHLKGTALAQLASASLFILDTKKKERSMSSGSHINSSESTSSTKATPPSTTDISEDSELAQWLKEQEQAMEKGDRKPEVKAEQRKRQLKKGKKSRPKSTVVITPPGEEVKKKTSGSSGSTPSRGHRRSLSTADDDDKPSSSEAISSLDLAESPAPSPHLKKSDSAGSVHPPFNKRRSREFGTRRSRKEKKKEIMEAEAKRAVEMRMGSENRITEEMERKKVAEQVKASKEGKRKKLITLLTKRKEKETRDPDRKDKERRPSPPPEESSRRKERDRDDSTSSKRKERERRPTPPIESTTEK